MYSPFCTLATSFAGITAKPSPRVNGWTFPWALLASPEGVSVSLAWSGLAEAVPSAGTGSPVLGPTGNGADANEAGLGISPRATPVRDKMRQCGEPSQGHNRYIAIDGACGTREGVRVREGGGLVKPGRPVWLPPEVYLHHGDAPCGPRQTTLPITREHGN